MADARVTLVVAAFLDSDAARSLEVPAAARRRLAELIVSSAVEHVGAAPRTLDGDQVREVLLEVVPRRLGLGDADAAHVPAVARAFFSDLAERELVPHAFEIERALDDVDAGFAAATERVRPEERIAGATETIRNRAAPLGRNDPCPCGSGRKWKKCCANR